MLCYMSIGQAEDYRSYWQPQWKERPPDLAGPARSGLARGRSGQVSGPGWQGIIFGKPESYLDQLIALGCDGVYLDRVDAYDYYKAQGREGAAREMVDFVIALSAYARQRSPGFGIFPQNAEELGISFPTT